MKLRTLTLRNYRSIRDQVFDLEDLNVFIGANASGKSTILDALRFVHEAVQPGGFDQPIGARGGIVHLAWKGEHSASVGVRVELVADERNYAWDLRLDRRGYEFVVRETVEIASASAPPAKILEAEEGKGWWWSGDERDRVALDQASTACALASASANAAFPGRGIAAFVRGWGFFDPNPYLLRHDRFETDSDRLDPYGRNLARTLHALRESAPSMFDDIVAAARALLGLPESIEPREHDGRFYFVQGEPGLRFPVHQIGASSGTLRVLALLVALHASSEASLIGIEEPENYVHPAALSALVDLVRDASDRVQFLITTHSPLLLDILGQPEAVRVVRRDENGTSVAREPDPDGVRTALRESGFGLGEYHETKGFGSL